MYFLTFKVALIFLILGSISLCFGEEMTEEQYRDLLNKPIQMALMVRNPFPGLYIGHEFIPVPGLDKEDAIPFLKKTLKEGLPGTRGPRLAQCYVALCLGKIGDDSVIEDLLAIMNTEDDKDSGGAISEYCVRALGMIGTSKAKEEIYKIFNNSKDLLNRR